MMGHYSHRVCALIAQFLWNEESSTEADKQADGQCKTSARLAWLADEVVLTRMKAYTYVANCNTW